jgi:hypothetical protein
VPLGAERITSRDADQEKLAQGYNATDIVAEGDEEGIARLKDLTDWFGSHSVVEAVVAAIRLEVFKPPRKPGSERSTRSAFSESLTSVRSPRVWPAHITLTVVLISTLTKSPH